MLYIQRVPVVRVVSLAVYDPGFNLAMPPPGAMIRQPQPNPRPVKWKSNVWTFDVPSSVTVI
jgi:hypothetical protein